MSTALQDVLSQVEACERALQAAPTEAALRQAYAQYGGREGTIKRAVSAAIAAAPKEQKRELGQVGNTALQRIEAAFEARLASLAGEARGRDLERRVDVTLPGREPWIGHLHPLTHTRREIERIFAQLGYAVAAGPQVESDFYNFEALAMPKDHPARDMQDTFYVAGAEDVLLRTHTSPVQIRTMLAQRPPVRVIIPGTVYRRDDDPTHSPMFHQVEGLVVDTDVTFADLKGTLLHFVRAFFGPKAGIRLRPSFFPFTEPSAEVDATCVFCAGAGKLSGERAERARRAAAGSAEGAPGIEDGTPCRTCKTTGWMELGGAGMVDPEVFRHVGYDAEMYTGFAFGFGIDRMAMLKYRINDIGLLYQGDMRFLGQFE